MIFLHLLAEERPFSENDKEMVDLGWGKTRAPKEAALNSNAHVENNRTSSKGFSLL